MFALRYMCCSYLAIYVFVFFGSCRDPFAVVFMILITDGSACAIAVLSPIGRIKILTYLIRGFLGAAILD